MHRTCTGDDGDFARLVRHELLCAGLRCIRIRTGVNREMALSLRSVIGRSCPLMTPSENGSARCGHPWTDEMPNEKKGGICRILMIHSQWINGVHAEEIRAYHPSI